MKYLFDKLGKSKAQLIVTLACGQQLRLNLSIYKVDTSMSDEFVLLNYKNNEFLVIKYSEIATIKYYLKPCFESF